MANSNGFDLDLPELDDPRLFYDWQRRMVELLDFTLGNSGVTTDGNQAEILRITLETETVYYVESWVLGVLLGTNGVLVPGMGMLNVWKAAVKLNVSEAATYVGSGASKFYSGASYGATVEPWTTSLALDGKDVAQKVTGVANDVIRWRCRMKIFTVSI